MGRRAHETSRQDPSGTLPVQMNERESNILNSQIRARIRSLRVQLEKSQTISESKLSLAGDPDARLDLTISSTVETRVMASARSEIRMLEENLRWLDSEQGGLCASCGEEIPHARLKAVPETRLCIACAEKL